MSEPTKPVSRRGFIQTSAAATALGSLAVPAVHAAAAKKADRLKIAIVGCGGRGSGATLNALNADPNVELVAVCDIFEDRAKTGLANLTAAMRKTPEKINVAPDHIFSGFDGYKAAIDACDVAVLATSPGFRPLHLAYAVGKDKHVFMEKPHATDIAGAKSVLASAQLAKEKGLGLVSGFCYRYDDFKRETVKRIHEKQIGDVTAIHTRYLTGPIWERASETKDPKQMEYQLRMWYYFTWLSGDFLVEQAIHNVDKAAWVMGGMPVSATGLGGRQTRTDPKFGNIFDHFSIVYEYENGAKVFLECRQMPGTKIFKGTQDFVYGTKGNAELMSHTINTGGTTWTHPGEHNFGQMYQQEHNELFASIRAGKPLNDGERSAHSTLMGIMGREAAYSGQKITWKQLLKSDLTLTPKEYAWGANPQPEAARPGEYRFA